MSIRLHINWKRTLSKFLVSTLTGFVLLNSTSVFGDDETLKPAPLPKPIPITDRDAVRINFNFKDADLRAVIKFIARLNGLIPIIDDDITGAMSVTTPTKMTLKEAGNVLDAVLDARDFTVIHDGAFMKVTKKQKALQKPVDVFFGADAKDTPDEDRMITQVVPLQHAASDKVLGNLRPLISSSGNSFFDREANMVVITDVASNVRRLLKLIHYLDAEPPEGLDADFMPVTQVYPIKYLKVKEIADALAKIFKATRVQRSDGKEERVEVNITPVDVASALIIQAVEQTQTQIAKTIEDLDQRRPQVLMLVKILEASYTKGMDFGSKLALKARELGRDDKGAKIYQNTLTNGQLPKNQFITYAFKSWNVDFAVSAMQKTSKFKLLSQPRLMTTDNCTAKMIVGSQEPYVKSVTQISENNNTVSDFTYLDVGLELELTPHINHDSDVLMDLKLKITKITEWKKFETGTSQTEAPVTAKRETETSVLVRDGNTLILSGIIEKQASERKDGLPYLIDIPLIGWIFSDLSDSNNQTELVLLITPKVISSEDEVSRETRRQEDDIMESERLYDIYGQDGVFNEDYIEEYFFKSPQQRELERLQRLRLNEK